MERILIIGNAGSGKTTFARALAQKTGLPLVHLDQLYWCGNWQHLDRDTFDRLLQNALDQPQWIIDGNFHRTLPHRLSYCDTVFFFDLPKPVCLWGITKRVLTGYGKSRPDMGGNCPEYFDRQKISLYRNVLRYDPAPYRALLQNTGVQTVFFKSRRQAKAYLDQL